MKRNILHYRKKLIFLLAVVLLFVLAGCAASAPAAAPELECVPTCPADIQPKPPAELLSMPSPSQMVPRITIDELRQKLESKADILVVDNRSKAEYDVDHIANAVSAPLSIILAGEWTFPPGTELIFYCA